MAAIRVALSALLLGAAGASRLRGNQSHSQNQSFSLYEAASQCTCQASGNWQKPTRTEPKCIFIDLGAADGNTWAKLMENGYGPVKNCPGGKWEAFLVEANPKFTPELTALQENFPGQVHSYSEHAAFGCEGTTSFFLDKDDTHNNWGSSMDANSPDAVKSGQVKVTVPMVNVVKLIAENTIANDWVMLKVDIEGAEYSLIPCLAEFQQANLVDRMFLEEHWWFSSVTEASKTQMAASKTKLQAMHVDIPGYYSATL